MITRKTLLVLFCTLVFPVCPLLYGQATGSFSGTVTDKTGSVISGADVKATVQGTGISRESKTDDSGHYLMPLLPIGEYTIRVESQGFGPVEQKDVRLQVDEHRELNFTLTPGLGDLDGRSQRDRGGGTDHESDSGSGHHLGAGRRTPAERTQFRAVGNAHSRHHPGNQSQQLFQRRPQQRSLGARNLLAFRRRIASAEHRLAARRQRQQRTDRRRHRDPAFHRRHPGIQGSHLQLLGGIRHARGSDGACNHKIRNATALHGSLFEFFRNTKLDARSYFASSREQFNLNQFGGSLGGPIKKDKTFFFVDYQGKMQRHGIPFVGLIPTQAMVNGDFTRIHWAARRGVTSYNGFVFPDLNNPFTFSPLQCDGAGNPIAPDSDGSPDWRHSLQQDSGCHDRPDRPGDDEALSGQQRRSTPPPLTNFANVPVRRLNEGEFDVAP